jgi:hypothetical protein
MAAQKKAEPTEIAITSPSQYAICKIVPGDMKSIMRENLGDEPISAFDLERVKFPAGGNTIWKMQTASGNKNVEEICGVIVFWNPCRAMWTEAFTGKGVPPDCKSIDAVVGIGVGVSEDNPRGLCNEKFCPMARFESADNGIGQACKAMRQLFLIRETGILPLVITLPPTSIDVCKKYFMSLLSEQTPYYGVVTRFTLTEAHSRQGIAYSKVQMEAIHTLSQTEIASMRAYQESMRTSFSHVETFDDAMDGVAENPVQ